MIQNLTSFSDVPQIVHSLEKKIELVTKNDIN